MDASQDKKSTALSETAKKIVQVIQRCIAKIRLIGVFETLTDKFSEITLSAELDNAVTTYSELSKKADASKFPEDDTFLAEVDHLLYILKKGITMEWEKDFPETVILSGVIGDFFNEISLFGNVTYEMFSQTANEWNAEEKFLNKYAQISVINAALITKLESELPSARGAKNKAVKEKEGVVAGIKDNIDHVERIADGNIRFMRENSKLKIDVIESKSIENLRELDKVKEKLNKEVQKAKISGLPNQLERKQHCDELIGSIEWLIDHYGVKMADIQHEFDKTWEEFSAEMEKSRSICMRYAYVKEIADNLKVENRKAFEEEIKQKLELRRRMKAATIIQRAWRALLASRKPKKAEHKGKKAKKGKKK